VKVSVRRMESMCGRYAITMPPEAVREWFRTYGEIPNWPV